MIRSNVRSGNVTRPNTVRDLTRARRDLIAIGDNLKSLSGNGPPICVLIHTAEPDKPLRSRLVSPEGGIESDASPVAYSGLDEMSAALGVKRFVAHRMPREKGLPPVSGMSATAQRRST